jgi:hypothetical protein
MHIHNTAQQGDPSFSNYKGEDDEPLRLASDGSQFPALAWYASTKNPKRGKLNTIQSRLATIDIAVESLRRRIEPLLFQKT